MTTAVTGLLHPATREEQKRRRGVVLGAAATSILSLLGGIIFLLFSGQTPTQQAPLKPRSTPSTVASAPPTAEVPSSSGDLLGAMGANLGDTGSSSAADLYGTPGGSVPLGGAALPALEIPPVPETPAVNWDEVLAPAVQAQQDAVAANLGAAVTGPVVGAVSSGINSSAVLLGDIILYAAYTNNGGGLLNQLQTAIPAAAAAPALAAAGSVPGVDFGGLNTAFAAASSMPPIGLPAPAQLPQLPQFPPPPQLPPLPTPEQALAALSALPAIGALPALPGLPPLPTPEQALAGASAGAAAMAAIPAMLPGLPPIGLPQIGLPQPPDLSGLLLLPLLGLLPSPTRMIGLPF